MPLTSVAICLTDFILTGQMQLEQARLIDMLNTTMDPVLAIQEPAPKPLRGAMPRFSGASVANVRRRDIVLAIPLESPEVLQRRTEQRIFAYQPKMPCPAFLSVPPYRIIGSVNLNPGTTLQDVLLGMGNDFLAITAIQTLATAEAALSIPPVVIVNRMKIEIACYAT